ncbi:MAG: hypothetical protein ABL911_11810 [Gallionella sp.]
MRTYKLSSLLSTLLIGGVLTSTSSAFAETDAERIKNLEDKLDAVRTELSQMTSGMAHHSNSGAGLPLHGFADIGFATNNGSLTDNQKGFFVGSLSFYLSPNFGDRVKALIEPNFEITPAGEVAVDLERVQIGYTVNDALTAWGGRIHTPYGYWNTGFHHGGQMQTSVLRPRFLDFEDKGGILPAHIVGLWGAGKVKAGTGKVTYDVYAGNGPQIADDPSLPNSATNLGTLTINQAGDNNHQAMMGFNAGYEFFGNLDGLKLAAHGLKGDVDSDVSAGSNTELNMFGGSAVYLANDWEALSEYYHFNDNDKSGNTGSHKSWAAYAQIGKSFNDWTPYARLEKAVLDQSDNYFASQASGQSYARQALGLRYNLNQNAALKIELLNSDFAAEANRTASSYHSLYAQYAVGF